MEHGCNGVYSEAVNVVAIQPGDCVGEEKRLHLAATVIEDVRSPVRVFPLPWIGMFVESGSVEAAEGMSVLGEVRRYPVEDDADAGSMTGIDEVHEVFRRAVA